MLDSLHNALSERALDPELRAIVIRGNGPVFSAGHDLKELVRAFPFTLLLDLQWFNVVMFSSQSPL